MNTEFQSYADEPKNPDATTGCHVFEAGPHGFAAVDDVFIDTVFSPAMPKNVVGIVAVALTTTLYDAVEELNCPGAAVAVGVALVSKLACSPTACVKYCIAAFCPVVVEPDDP